MSNTISYENGIVNFLKRLFNFTFKHFFRNPIYLTVYTFCYFLKDFKLNVSFYKYEELRALLEKDKSIIRFGDGEIYIMNYGSIHYQKFNKALRKTYFYMVREYTDNSPYILGLNQGGVTKTNTFLRENNALNLWLPSKVVYLLNYNKKATYIDNGIFYHRNIFKQQVLPYIKNKHVIVITREGTIDYIKKENKEIENISYVKTPDFQAYDVYEEIVKEVKLAIKKSDLKPVLLVAIGPATKALVYDFSKNKVQGIDVGRGLEFIFSNEGLEHMLLPNT